MMLNRNDQEMLSFIHDMGFSEDDLFDQKDSDGDRDKPYEYLTAEQIEFAAKIRGLTKGVMLVTGKQGSGKDMFANFLSWKIKTYFKGRKVLRDDKPFPAFGLYLPFNAKILTTQLSTMEVGNKPQKGGEDRDDDINPDNDKLDDKKIKQLADAWLETEMAEKYLRGSVLLITELKKYVHNRHMTSYGRALGHIITRWRHFGMLIIGITPYENEIDFKGFRQYVGIDVHCVRNLDKTTTCHIFQTNYEGFGEVLSISRKLKPIKIDGKVPVEELGGLRWYDIYNSYSMPSSSGGGTEISLSSNN